MNPNKMKNTIRIIKRIASSLKLFADPDFLLLVAWSVRGTQQTLRPYFESVRCNVSSASGPGQHTPAAAF